MLVVVVGRLDGGTEGEVISDCFVWYANMHHSVGLAFSFKFTQRSASEHMCSDGCRCVHHLASRGERAYEVSGPAPRLDFLETSVSNVALILFLNKFKYL